MIAFPPRLGLAATLRGTRRHNPRRSNGHFALAFLSLLILPFPCAGATEPEARADGILQLVRDRDDGKDVISDLKLIIGDRKGRTRERTLIYLQRDFPGEDRLTLYFTAPADVRGVAFQSINYDENTGTEDDQWMYLPAFRQVRRIATTDKWGSFMGSEFSYYDLDKLRVHDYRQRLTGEEKVLGRRCWVIERIPKGECIIAKTGYHKTRVWVDKKAHVVLRQTYYDAKDVLFKELEVKELSRRQSIWTIDRTQMTNHVEDKHSNLIFSNVKYNVGLVDALFRRDILRSGVHGYLPEAR